MTELKHNILETIEKKGVKMIPKWHFALYSGLGVFGIIFFLLTFIYVTSLGMFLLSAYGFIYLPLFGMGPMVHGLTALPKSLLFIGLICLLFIELLSRQYRFSFKRPIIVTILGLIAFSWIVGFIINMTTFHTAMRDFGRKSMPKAMYSMYERPMPFKKESGKTVLKGVVLSTSSESFILSSFDKGTTSVLLSEKREDITLPFVGEEVVVFGEVKEGVMTAEDIRSPRKPFTKRGRHHSYPQEKASSSLLVSPERKSH